LIENALVANKDYTPETLLDADEAPQSDGNLFKKQKKAMKFTYRSHK
jgi:hypothetical protein